MATSKSLSRNSYKIAEKEDQNNPALAINARLLREDAGSNPAISKFKVSDPLGVSLACFPLVAPCSRASFLPIARPGMQHLGGSVLITILLACARLKRARSSFLAIVRAGPRAVGWCVMWCVMWGRG